MTVQSNSTTISAIRVKRTDIGTDEERFWRKVDKSGECWLWTAAVVRGYGRFILTIRTNKKAHRFAYENLVGAIPDGYDIHHLCGYRLCVNPKHLAAVPRSQHTRLYHQPTTAAPKPHHVRVTHCKQGHELVGDNILIITANGNGWIRGMCLACSEAEGGAK